MCIRLLCAILVLAASCADGALAQQKSEQNAADEAVVKGDLEAARKSGDPRKVDEAEKKLEQSAEDAKNKTGGSGGPVQVGPQFADLSEQQRRVIYDVIRQQQATAASQVATAEVGSAEVGAVIPPSVDLRALPGDVTTRIPGTSTYRYIVSGDRVLLVEPTERSVVGVLGP